MTLWIIIFLVVIIACLYNDSTRPATKKVIRDTKNKVYDKCKGASKKK